MGRRNRHAKSVRHLLAGLCNQHPGETIRAAEIGVWEGSTSKMLLEQIPDLYLIMVDPWLVFEEYLASGDPTATKSQDQFDEIAELARTQTLWYADRRTIIRLKSIEAARLIAVNVLHLVFLDGNHAEESVTEDLGLWWPKVCPGGIMCGHDYGSGGCNRGVKPAVDRWAEQNHQTIEVLPGKVFWTQKVA